MSLRRLAIAAGAGEPDGALALRIDVVAAAVKVVEAMDAEIGEQLEDKIRWQANLDVARCQLDVKTRRYIAACKRCIK